MAFVAPARADIGSVVVAANLMFAPGDPRLPAQTSPSITVGQDLEFVQADAVCRPCDHTLTSVAKDSRGKRLFDSGILAVGQQVMVPGVKALGRGSYPFFCAVHPSMKGTLVVS